MINVRVNCPDCGAENIAHGELWQVMGAKREPVVSQCEQCKEFFLVKFSANVDAEVLKIP